MHSPNLAFACNELFARAVIASTLAQRARPEGRQERLAVVLQAKQQVLGGPPPNGVGLSAWALTFRI